jgi:hypothetical protein
MHVDIHLTKYRYMHAAYTDVGVFFFCATRHIYIGVKMHVQAAASYTQGVPNFSPEKLAPS